MRQQVQNTRLLLVDDDSQVLGRFAEGLKDSGYQVLIVENAKAGLSLIHSEHPPHLAILGIRLPDMSGLEMAQALRLLQVPWIFLSDDQDERCLKQAVEGGALGYLIKPVDVARAIPTIEVALHRAIELFECKQSEHRLIDALETGNLVNVVIGLLMERNRLNRQDAYGLLRAKARSEQRKVRIVAAEILAAWENVNLLQQS